MSTLLALGLANAACAALLAVPAHLVGRFALTCGYGGVARLWNGEAGAQLKQLVDHCGKVWIARFSPDGREALTAGGGTWVDGKPVKGDDFAIRVWRIPATR